LYLRPPLNGLPLELVSAHGSEEKKNGMMGLSGGRKRF